MQWATADCAANFVQTSVNKHMYNCTFELLMYMYHLYIRMYIHSRCRFPAVVVKLKNQNSCLSTIGALHLHLHLSLCLSVYPPLSRLLTLISKISFTNTNVHTVVNMYVTPHTTIGSQMPPNKTLYQ